jgi:alpha-tubulin suppressor-like RCC1 family protein
MPSDHNQDSRLSPRRVDDLKSVCVVAVAAGDRHSVVLTKTGEWGKK